MRLGLPNGENGGKKYAFMLAAMGNKLVGNRHGRSESQEMETKNKAH